MRIAQVLPYAEFGGTERHCLTLCKELAAQHEVTLVSPPGPALADLPSSVAHIAFPRWDQSLRCGIGGYLTAIRSLRVDLVHVHAAAELVFATRLALPRRPLVFTVHGFHGRGSDASYTLARWAMRLTDRTICVSRSEQTRLPGATLIYNGVEDPGFTPLPANGLAGFVGRLERSKGVDVLIGSGVRPVLVVGDGSERIALEAQADPGVTFTGRRSDAVSLMAGCDVIAVPSRQEPFGLVAIEAAAVGRPVVASAVGGLSEIVVSGETGFLVPPDDPGALGQALHQILEDPQQARQMGDAARQRYLSMFSSSRMVEATEEVYRELAPGS